VAEGRVELGFQQLSELMNLPGVEVIGPLPEEIQTLTVFSGAVSSTSARPAEARALLDFMARPAAAALKRQYGMEAAG
jgi:molybdate transport system substrate-binding protein